LKAQIHHCAFLLVEARLERFEAGLKNLQKSIFLVVYLKLSVRKLRLGVRTFKCTLDGLFVKLDVGRTNARCGNANVALVRLIHKHKTSN